MLESGSVTHWIQLIKQGDREATQPLWERYHKRIIGLARKCLQQSLPWHADEEDVALEAFNDFFRAVEAGRFPQLADRDDLWRLLVVITRRKSIDQNRKARCFQEAHRAVDAATMPHTSAEFDVDLEQIVASEPTPEMAAQLVEEYDRLLASLADKKLQQIAVWKLQGLNNEQIAQKLGCSRRTVVRKLEMIRFIWRDVSRK